MYSNGNTRQRRALAGSEDVLVQKMDYIHRNPVVSGFVHEPEHWKYSSAIDYSGGKGVLEVDYV